MVFSQPTFLFLFLPIVVLVHLIAPTRVRNAWLLAASLVFYAYGEMHLVLLLVGSAWMNQLLGRAVMAARRRGAPTGRIVGLAVAMNLAGLFVFKYAPWLLGELHGALGEPWTERAASWSASHLTLPLGISFFTFQALSFVIDLARDDAPAPRGPVDFPLYLALFPQLVAGPIVRYRDLAEQLVDRRVSAEGFADGARRFIFGLAKKVLIADVLAGPADSVFGLEASGLTPTLAWVGCAAYTLQIYFDFSGYSDMAIGIGQMLGFRLPENFLHPYASRSITEFWRRWHVSLSTWFRDYLYVPLGGNRGGKAATVRNLWIVFLLCGLWHGAAWTFVVWGAFHGGWLAVERFTPWGEILNRCPRPISTAVTVLIVAAGWVLFRAESMASAGSMYAAMGGGGGELGQALALHLDPREAWTLALGTLLAAPLAPAIQERFAGGLTARAASFLWAAGLLAATIVGLAGQTHSPFLYFRF